MRYRCKRDCFQPIFGNQDRNVMVRYTAWTEYEFPDEVHDQIPLNLFDRLSQQVEDAPEAQKVEPVVSTEDDKPVWSLFKMGPNFRAQLAAHGITTVGHARAAMTNPEKVQELLESKNIDCGPGTIRKFKMYLGIKG